MKKLLMVLAATSAALFPNMSAAQATGCVHTDPPATHPEECDDFLDANSIGGCSFAAVSDAVAGQGQMTGEIDIEAVVYSSNPAQNPMSATFTCYILVNGAAQPGAVVSATGTVVVVGGGIVTYTSDNVANNVELCQRVQYSNGVVTEECFEATSVEIPPQIVWDIVDPAVCPILEELAGTYYIPPPVDMTVVIEAKDPLDPGDIGGDVYINGELFFDCPRYEAV